MSNKLEKLTDEFDTVSEDGQQFHMLVYTTMIMINDRSGSKMVEVSKRICTLNEQSCNRIDDDTFDIVELDLRVKRV